MPDDNLDDDKPLGFFQMMGSVLASFFGVQSSKNRERDFKRGKASQFIAVGVLSTALLFTVLYIVVSVVLAK
jgi:Protein of unknown function (DUF2970)